MFITALIIPVFEKLKKRSVPSWVAILLVFMAVIGFIRLADGIMAITQYEYSLKSEEISEMASKKLTPVLEQAEKYIGIDLSKDFDWNSFNSVVSSDGIVDSVSPLVDTFNSLVGMYLMIIIYLIIMLSGAYKYEDYLLYIGGEKNGAGLLTVINKWINDLRIYIRVKAAVSLVTGALFAGICLLFGIDFALFFGFIAFVLNFVPQLGSLIATIFPALLGFVQIESIWMATFFAVTLVAVQFIMGNVIEVKYIGKSFAISTVVVFVNLIFWGFMWGVAGVLLSVPIIILLKNIANYHNPDGMFAKMLSKNES